MVRIRRTPLTDLFALWRPERLHCWKHNRPHRERRGSPLQERSRAEMRQPQARSSGFDRNVALRESTGNELALSRYSLFAKTLRIGHSVLQARCRGHCPNGGPETFNVLSINGGAAIGAVPRLIGVLLYRRSCDTTVPAGFQTRSLPMAARLSPELKSLNRRARLDHLQDGSDCSLNRVHHRAFCLTEST